MADTNPATKTDTVGVMSPGVSEEKPEAKQARLRREILEMENLEAEGTLASLKRRRLSRGGEPT